MTVKLRREKLVKDVVLHKSRQNSNLTASISNSEPVERNSGNMLSITSRHVGQICMLEVLSAGF